MENDEKYVKVLPVTPVPDVVDRNGMMYPREVLDKAITEWFERGSGFVTMSQSPTPLDGSVNMMDVCGKIESLDLESYKMTMRVMDTPQGKILKEIIESPLKISCGFYGQKDTELNQFKDIRMISAVVRGT